MLDNTSRLHIDENRNKRIESRTELGSFYDGTVDKDYKVSMTSRIVLNPRNPSSLFSGVSPGLDYNVIYSSLGTRYSIYRANVALHKRLLPLRELYIQLIPLHLYGIHVPQRTLKLSHCYIHIKL